MGAVTVPDGAGPNSRRHDTKGYSVVGPRWDLQGFSGGRADLLTASDPFGDLDDASIILSPAAHTQRAEEIAGVDNVGVRW